MAQDNKLEPMIVSQPTVAFMLKHPLHTLALGFGSGLSPWAPGTR